MILEKHKGYVIGTTPLSTSRTIVTLYTFRSGKRKGILRLTRRTRAYLGPLLLLNFQLRGKEHQELLGMDEVSLESHQFDLASDYLGLTLLQHWAFLLDRSQADGHGDERVFRLLGHCLEKCRERPDPNTFPRVNLYLEVWLLHFAGLLPRGQALSTATGLTATDLPGADETTLWRALDSKILCAVFQTTLGDFLADALQLETLVETQRVLGLIWERFLGYRLKTRELLIKQLEKRSQLNR